MLGFVCPLGHGLARSALFCGWRKEGLEGIRRPLLLRVSAILPCGASGVAGVPSPTQIFYSITLFTLFLYPSWSGVLGAPARTGGRPRGACGEGACDRCGRPPVRRTLAPPFGLCAGLFLPALFRPQAVRIGGSPPLRLVYRPNRYTFRSTQSWVPSVNRHILCSWNEYHVYTKDPFPLESPGALGYSPVAFRFLVLLFPI